jgi:hypothetical protein
LDDPFCTFTQFAEPVSATLADQSKHARPLSTFEAFQAHFLSAFAGFHSGICAVAFSFDSQSIVYRSTCRVRRWSDKTDGSVALRKWLILRESYVVIPGQGHRLVREASTSLVKSRAFVSVLRSRLVFLGNFKVLVYFTKRFWHGSQRSFLVTRLGKLWDRNQETAIQHVAVFWRQVWIEGANANGLCQINSRVSATFSGIN